LIAPTTNVLTVAAAIRTKGGKRGSRDESKTAVNRFSQRTDLPNLNQLLKKLLLKYLMKQQEVPERKHS
jgi:hypothetical protein